MTDAPNRRAVLAAVSGGLLAGLAGCSGGATGTDPDAAASTRSTDASSVAKTTGDETTADGTGTTTESNSTTATTERPPEAVQTVRFVADGGGEVVGTLYPAGSCAVVLVPQINLDRGSWEPQARALRTAGYTALAIDERPDARADSVLGAVRYLRARKWVQRIVLVGASTGGEAVVRASARAEPGAVAGTVALSAAGGEEVAADLQGRLLVVASEGDEGRFVETARALHDGAPDPKRLVVYDGGAHGQRLFESSHGDDLLGRITSLLGAACDGG